MKPIQFLQISDTHLFRDASERICGLDTTAVFQEVLTQARRFRSRSDFVLLTGDVSQDGTPASYHKLCRLMAPMGLPVYCLPGNHDNPRQMKRVLASGRRVHGQFQLTTEVKAGPWRLILLNSARPPHPGGLLRKGELKKLRQKLRLAKEKNILISLHHHPVPVGSKWMDRMIVQNNKAFLRIIKNNPRLRAVVFGHVHQEFKTKKNGVLYLGTPSTCVQFLPRSNKMRVDKRHPGFRWFKLLPDGRIRTEVIRIKKISQRPDYHSDGY